MKSPPGPKRPGGLFLSYPDCARYDTRFHYGFTLRIRTGDRYDARFHYGFTLRIRIRARYDARFHYDAGFKTDSRPSRSPVTE
jgi:hypothetical protein